MQKIWASLGLIVKYILIFHSFIKHALDVLLLCSYVLFTNTLVTGVKMTHGFLSLNKVHCSVLFHLLLFLFFPLLAKGKESAVGNAYLHLISLTKFLHSMVRLLQRVTE